MPPVDPKALVAGLAAALPKRPPVLAVLLAPKALFVFVEAPKGDVEFAGAAPKGRVPVLELLPKPPNPEVDLPNICSKIRFCKLEVVESVV